jgi:hypothetical protein
MLGTFRELGLPLQIVAVVALIAFVSIAGFKLWQYLQKRRTRSRWKNWMIY